MYNIPVLFLIFNRPDTTVKVFERIREIKPVKLYVAADGPREGRPDEVMHCKETRSIIDKIDWPCEVKTLFRNNNLGCKIGVSNAINWFFEQEEYGVILEDDCLPDLSFFRFCEELLVKYKDDDRIGHIGGNCFFQDVLNDDLSYGFCSFPHIWGWATWRRVWKNYDINFEYWKEAKHDKNKRQNLLRNLRERLYFSSYISDAINNRNMNAWSVQYLFMLRVQNQLSIYPSVNLVTNIGLNSPNATNTKKSGTKNCIPAKTISFPLKHPRYMVENQLFNKLVMKNIFFSYRRIFRYIIKDY